MNNEEIRVAIFESRFSKAEIAEEAGIKRDTLSHWLMKELDPMRKTVILNAIQRLKEKR
jgi:predicted XRE-type DNA-binding protein